jgi:Protein of unknown function (DUF3606)
MIAASVARRIVSGSTCPRTIEVASWSKKWGISHAQLAEAVQKAGSMSRTIAKLQGKEP